MVCVIIPFPIKGYAISYHSDLKYNVQIENIEPHICFRYVLNNNIDIYVLQIYQRVQLFPKVPITLYCQIMMTLVVGTQFANSTNTILNNLLCCFPCEVFFTVFA